MDIFFPPVLFIFNHPFSGSTLMARIFNTAPGTYLLADNAEGQRVMPGLFDSDRWDENKKVDYALLRKTWISVFNKIARNKENPKLIIEKSPPNIVRAPQLLDAFPDHYVLVFNRSPYAQISSFYHRLLKNKKITKEKKPFLLERSAWKWIDLSTRMINIISTYNCYYFTYEKFCSNPQKVMSEIISLIPELSEVDLTTKVKIKDYPPQGIINQNPRQIELLNSEDIRIISDVLKTHTDIMDFWGYKLMC